MEHPRIPANFEDTMLNALHQWIEDTRGTLLVEDEEPHNTETERNTPNNDDP
jgi:hypothetical protein